MKLLVPLKVSTVLLNATMAPPRIFLKVVFPVNVRLLLMAKMPATTQMNSLFFTRVMLVLFTTSAVLGLSWKEQLTSSASCVECNSRA